ncbi:MAG: sigma 54-interacting transcriptional regulator [Deltaproteobacteria bacterium]|nr:sigma 54-interacting transcriptional regulator [Deltaproteobacteria bacterium]
MSSDPEKTPAVPERTAIRRAVSLALRTIASPDAGAVGRIHRVLTAVSIGRKEGGADLAVADPNMSRRHAHVELRRGVLVAEDAGSTNGTFVAGARLPPGAPRPLALGDVIRVADTLIVVVDEREHAAWTAPPWASALIGSSAALRDLVDEIGALATSSLPVLLAGPTGAGKELVARALHAASGAAGAFVALNCGAIPETLAESALFGHTKGAFTGADSAELGAFRRADGGTLFLDEIAELAAANQAKLLRAADSGEVQAIGAPAPVSAKPRIVAATHADLTAEVERGAFRRDLYMRIAAYVLRVPALSERRGDIAMLLRHAMSADARGRTLPSLDAQALERIVLHEFSGNVRELKNLAAQLWLYQDAALDESHLPDSFFHGGERPPRAPLRSTPTAPSSLAQIPPELEALMQQHRGNVSAVAAALGKDRKQVYRWLEQLELDAEAFR